MKVVEVSARKWEGVMRGRPPVIPAIERGQKGRNYRGMVMPALVRRTRPGTFELVLARQWG